MNLKSKSGYNAKEFSFSFLETAVWETSRLWGRCFYQIHQNIWMAMCKYHQCCTFNICVLNILQTFQKADKPQSSTDGWWLPSSGRQWFNSVIQESAVQNYRISNEDARTIFQLEEAPSCPLFLTPPHSNLWNTKKAEIHNTNLV